MNINYSPKTFKTAIATAFKETGFAVISNHPINLQLIEEVHHAWCVFFDSNNKQAYQYNKKTLDGYFSFGEEKETYKRLDLKEFYYFYPWGKCPSSLREKTLLLYNELVNFGEKILDALEDGLPSSIRKQLSMPLIEMVKNSNRAVLRLLHYPAISSENAQFLKETQKGAIRAKEHEDLTLISIIMPLLGNGLEIRDLLSNYHKIPDGPDKLVINIGDMLSLCTQGFYKATTHRVINPTEESMYYSRYSNAFFLNPKDDVQLTKEHTALDCLERYIKEKLECKRPDLSGGQMPV